MKNELKVHFYLKRNEIKSDGTSPILGRITVGKSMVQFSAKCSVMASLWDTKSNRALGKSKQATSINKVLNKINVSIHLHHKELIAKKDEITALEIKDAFQGVDYSQKKLIECYFKHNEEFKKSVGITKTLGTYKRYTVSINHLKNFIQTKYNLTDIPFRTLDHSFIESYDFYLRIQLKFGNNTILGIVGHLRKIVKLAINNGMITLDPFANFFIRTSPISPKSLTQGELKKIMTTPLDHKNRYLVRDMFIFSCFTGLSFSDIRNLTKEHLHQSNDGLWWIDTTRQKTGSKCHIPLMEVPLQIIKKYKHANKKGKLLLMLSCSKTNINLKKIAKLCDIDKRITFHMARHTYASEITLSHGVPMETVSQMLGHQDLRATRIYAQISNEKIDKDMEELERRISNRYQLTD